MTPEQVKALFSYLESIQKGIDVINKDKTDDHEEQLKKYSDLMLAISNLITESKLLTDELKNLTKIIKKEHTDTQNIINSAVKEIEIIVTGKTRVMTKEVTKSRQYWFLKWIDVAKKRINRNGIKLTSDPQSP